MKKKYTTIGEIKRQLSNFALDNEGTQQSLDDKRLLEVLEQIRKNSVDGLPSDQEIKLLNSLLSKGANPNAKDKHPALWIALKSWNATVVKALLDAGADPNATTGQLGSIFVWAAYGPSLPDDILQAYRFNGGAYPDIVRAFIEAGVDVNLINDNKNALSYALIYSRDFDPALINEHYEVVKLLIDAGVNLNLDCGDLYSLTPLMYAIRNDNTPELKFVKLLLEEGADPNQRTVWAGKTPLSEAIEKGKLDAVKLLVEAGADVNQISCRDVPLKQAQAGNHTKIVDYLLSVGAKDYDPVYEKEQKRLRAEQKEKERREELGYELLSACKSGKAKKAFELIEQGADLTVRGKNGYTALICAASGSGNSSARIAIAENLLDNGADLEAKDVCGGTALWFATKYDNADMAVFLLEQGAKTEICGGGDRAYTPLMCACANGNLRIVKALVEAGADVMFTTAAYWGYPIRIASDNGHDKVVSYLRRVLNEMGYGNYDFT